MDEDSSRAFRLYLEIVERGSEIVRFRLAFHSSDDRYLLPYPKPTGLRFEPLAPSEAPEWKSSLFVVEPRDEFVLNPQDRIAFDVVACVKASPAEQRWVIELESGEYDVAFQYAQKPEEARYDYLNRGSRFADITKPWCGAINSNSLRITVP